mgnify:CR=1 FL=1
MTCQFRPRRAQGAKTCRHGAGSDLLCDRYTLCDISLMTFRSEELSQR